MDTKAFANLAADQPFGPYQFVRRTPGPADVSIDIKYCGICHSDIHTARSEWGPAFYPCVPGHEIVGVVSAIGAEVAGFKVGDAVGVGCLVDSCRTCSSCASGLEQYCENGWTGTYNSKLADGDYTKGGYSTHIVVDQRFVLRVPSNLDLPAVAPLLCAGITTYSPLKHVGVGKGDRVAILGLGGLGHMGVKLAASFGAEVTVISRSEHKRADAERLGAHKFLLSSDGAQIGSHANYFDYILDTVSAPHDVAQALSMIKREGTMLLVGASDKPLALETFPLIFNRRSIMGSLIGGLPQTQEMLDHCAK
ncbi:MAG: NAD(P)-dependent alcohol dehydrogenase, partial [Bdellovibrionales bacterium]|nr:NAD(P)-dependent alcohol dehydrogenase [Bdellovibrionales bacterium]